MAEVKIIISDTEESGVNFRIESSPPLDGTEEELTHAQAEAAFLLEIIEHRAEGFSLAEIAERVDDSEYGEVIKGTKYEYKPSGEEN